MIKLLEFIKFLIAGILFLVVIAGLPGIRNESGFKIAYAVLAVDVLFLGAALHYIYAHLEKVNKVRYFAIVWGVAVASWLAFMITARMINATDSSHGGSIWIVVAGSSAFSLVGSILIERRKRNS